MRAALEVIHSAETEGSDEEAIRWSLTLPPPASVTFTVQRVLAETDVPTWSLEMYEVIAWLVITALIPAL